MDVQFCPSCVARGVDCPLMLAGECIYCGHHNEPISHRIAGYEYRLRFAWDSFRFRVGVPGLMLRVRSAMVRLFAPDR